jgi:hypothetical protein
MIDCCVSKNFLYHSINVVIAWFVFVSLVVAVGYLCLVLRFCLSNGCIFHFVGIYAPSGAAITLKIMLFNSSSAKKVCCTPRITPHTRHSLTSININCLNCVNPVLIKPSLHTSPVLIRPHSCPVFIRPHSSYKPSPNLHGQTALLFKLREQGCHHATGCKRK